MMTPVDEWFIEHILPLEPALMQFLRKNLRKSDDHDDVRQDIYLRIYTHACRHGPPDNTGTILFVTARNLLIDRARRFRLAPMELMENTDALLESAIDELSPERIVSAREQIHLLQVAMNTMPARPREVIKLQRVEGKSRIEIAKDLGIAESTVDKHLKYGCSLFAKIKM